MAAPHTTAAPTTRTRWQKIARRIRVPLGFVVAAVFLVFAHPTANSLLLSLVLVLPGLWLRGFAAGYVKKNAELTCTGPYAYTRNPLYLGSMSIAFGFAVAAGHWWLAALLVALFLAIYIPTILSEEAFLRATFVNFDLYAQHVPRLLPRLTPARFASTNDVGSRRSFFSQERYLHHREYNSAMGTFVLYCALVLRMFAPMLQATLRSLPRH